MTVSDFEWQAGLFDEISKLVEEASSVAICAHTSPDGDAIGSALALAELIETAWPACDVTCLLADRDVVPRTYKFLPGTERFVHVDDYATDPDLFFCVDLSAPGRLNEARQVLERSRKVAVIDHHPSGERFWDAGVVRPDAAAAGVIVAEYAQHVLGHLTQTMAQNLLCAVITDTRRFQYQNANGEAFEVASMLRRRRRPPPDEVAFVNVYPERPLAYLHLCAKVMSRIATFESGKIAYSYVTDADFRACGVPVSECDGLVDLVRCVEGSGGALPQEVPGNQVAATSAPSPTRTSPASPAGWAGAATAPPRASPWTGTSTRRSPPSCPCCASSTPRRPAARARALERARRRQQASLASPATTWSTASVARWARSASGTPARSTRRPPACWS